MQRLRSVVRRMCLGGSECSWTSVASRELSMSLAALSEPSSMKGPLATGMYVQTCVFTDVATCVGASER